MPDVPVVRTQRSRASDRFDRDLREALRQHTCVVRGAMVLEDFCFLNVHSGNTHGVLSREGRKRVDYALIDSRSQLPFLAIVLTRQEFGRDRRRRQEPSSEGSAQGRSMISVLPLNPEKLVGVAEILRVLRPYLTLG